MDSLVYTQILSDIPVDGIWRLRGERGFIGREAGGRCRIDIDEIDNRVRVKASDAESRNSAIKAIQDIIALNGRL